MRDDYDVLVVGGGASGITAASQAARMGASTLLIEKNGALGGTTTVAGVRRPGLFHAWGTQVIAGIGWEIVTSAVEVAGEPLPDQSMWEEWPHWRLAIKVSVPIFAAVAEQTVLRSGADLSLHTMLGDLDWREDHWVATICRKEGLSKIAARRVIDCTGDADAVALAGYARRESQDKQPATVIARFGGYDPDTLDYELLRREFERAKASGELRPHDLLRPIEPFLRNGGENAIHVTGVSGGTSEGRTAAEVEGRATLLRIYRFLKRLPGLDATTIDTWSLETGIRETFTIEGHVTITESDYRTGRRWDDAVSNSFFPLDLHNPRGGGVYSETLEYGVIPSIPRRAMVPVGSPGSLIVAGRSISGDQIANSSYRVQASCMAMGQAAGAIAAVSLQQNCGVLDAPLDVITHALRQEGAIIPGDVTIPARVPAER